ncbi:nitrate/nitrite transport system substrate-binding protein [Kushneria sinocarnis]|uniref:Nitrate/nitrite transport system substrate-binding protein n=1 Tax=Kushneria sinocarnis TaxID=595502 RepID=A0A420WZ99_9GAMM|nr:CmpA/NrtA family ABC transporter substrate-binding protein [Kushneria sinocarnis]RKR06607.1 nitrate/nitrite transport system substrate-binding protein [Kushneria sinocarnis]
MMPTPLERRQLTLGMLPLADAAPLVAALHAGFFAGEGLEVTLSIEPSWANIRDRIQLGVLDAAQMLPLMPLAASLGLDGQLTPMLSALTLNRNGNAVTVSRPLFAAMQHQHPGLQPDDPASAGALAEVIAERRASGQALLRFATVYPFSSHRYQLRYWLGSAGIDPDRDLELRVMPPPQMAAQLEAGWLDGYCVGEPWNAMARRQHQGEVAISGHRIWEGAPEKVLGVTRAWHDAHPGTHQALLRALIRTGAWLDDDTEHRRQAARWMIDGGYLDAAPEDVERSLELRDDGIIFSRSVTPWPWRSQTLWYAAQMARWGHLPESESDAAHLIGAVMQCTRPDLCRQATDALGLPMPEGDSKLEGCHEGPWQLEGRDGGTLEMSADRFIDGAIFDPGRLDELLEHYRQLSMLNRPAR